MRINRALNLVIPLEDGETTIYVHSTPLSREAWESNYMVLSKTYAALFDEGLNIVAGPMVAGLILKDVAIARGVWDAVQGGLLNEIRRISNVVMPGPNGWTTIPLEDAVNRKVLDDETLSEAENIIVFFMCVSAVLRGPQNRAKLELGLSILSSLWKAQTTSYNSTEYARSLPTLTPEENTGVLTSVSSVPS